MADPDDGHEKNEETMVVDNLQLDEAGATSTEGKDGLAMKKIDLYNKEELDVIAYFIYYITSFNDYIKFTD